MKKKPVWFLFGLYCAVMVWLLFGQRFAGFHFEEYVQRLQWNLKPFRTLKSFLWVLQNSHQRGLVFHAVINLAGNVVMFVPVGLFLPLLWKKQQKLWVFLLTALAAIVLVELLQLVLLLGTCDVDDVLLNMIGAAIGWLGWKMTARN